MRSDYWSLENEWLNEFTEALVRETHRRVRDIAIDGEAGCLVVCGSARSYYAVQLAIHCVKTFNRKRSWFPTTRLLIDVDGHPIELRFAHSVRRANVIRPSTQSNNRTRELTLA